MPKYYRFRALTPTRKPKRNKDKDREREMMKAETVRTWLDSIALTWAPAPSWYLRRTSWRQSPPLMGLPRELSATLRSSVHLSNRPLFVFKMPVTELLNM